VTAGFVYARLQKGSDEIKTCYPPKDLKAWAVRLETWAAGKVPNDLPLIDADRQVKVEPRDVFAFMIHEGKVNAPFGAIALQEEVSK
jgi:uncharacterized protein YecE (DUF72 family)